MAIVAFECYTADAVVKFHCDFPFICWMVRYSIDVKAGFSSFFVKKKIRNNFTKV